MGHDKFLCSLDENLFSQSLVSPITMLMNLMIPAVNLWKCHTIMTLPFTSLTATINQKISFLSVIFT